MFNFFTLNLLLSLCFALTSHAAGPGTSGGGHGSRGEFYYLGDKLFKDLATIGVHTPALELSKRAFEELRETKILPEFTDSNLSIRNRPVNAINDFADFTLIINEPWWNKASLTQKSQILFHELLGLARKYDASIDDSEYKISSMLLTKLNEKSHNNFLYRNPELTELNVNSSNSDVKLIRAASKDSLSLAPAKKCLATPEGPAVTLKFKREPGDENRYTFSFNILCVLADGKYYGHRQGEGEIGIFKLGPNNLFEITSEFGTFIVGSISGKDLSFRTPNMSIELKENPFDDTYIFKFEFYSGEDGPAERVIGILKKN